VAPPNLGSFTLSAITELLERRETYKAACLARTELNVRAYVAGRTRPLPGPDNGISVAWWSIFAWANRLIFEAKSLLAVA
jgi:hypothetical protein